jgi:PAS domain S-box-containing protein
MNQKTGEPERRLPLRSVSLLARIQQYGLAILLVVAALGGGLLADYYKIQGVQFALFLFAIAVSIWAAGPGPGVLALILSCLVFNYFFTEPIHTLYVTRDDLPDYIAFLLFAALLSWFSLVRRRTEQILLKTRDELRLEVQERTRQANLLDLTDDMIFVRDMNAVITYWNRGAQNLYGFTSKEAVGKRSHELLRTVFPVPLEDIVAEVERTGRWKGELTHTKADGSRFIVLSRWSLQRDEKQQPIAILEVNTDITARKQREVEIHALNDELGKRAGELEAVNKELEAFAYSVSHDLRAPIRHISGFAELLQKNMASALDHKSQRHMAMILDSAKRMGTLIDDLLAFSRIGRAQAHKTMVSLQQLVQEALSDLAQETEGRNIVWRVGELPACYGDRAMLRLVLVNLVANAVKFTRTRAEAEIEIGSTNHNPDQIVIFVKDNGVGFDMKYVNKLFGVFQRLHTPEAFEGTGIGLATVQRVVHRHGGRTWAEGVVDQGATFYFSLAKSGESIK